IEVRIPHPTMNPYLGFSPMLMAGLARLKNKIHPGDSLDKDLNDLPKEEADAIPHVAVSFEEALAALEAARDFLI
ncbi:glutamine synthetase, partial [Psychromonas arctica]